MYERELNGYYKQAVRWLECGHMQRQKFRQYLVVSAEDYLSQRPEASFEEVCQALGTPQQAAQAFMEILPEGTARATGAKKVTVLPAAGVTVVGMPTLAVTA